ncbi:MAG: DUF6527 family protein [Methylocella sp.]
MKALSYKILTTVARYAEAAASIGNPGDCAIVERGGVHRQLVMRCPDGCGEILSVNLDGRSGPAWRLYKKRGVWSLFPSIDRPSGCLSHFILWHGRVLWCSALDGDEGGDQLIEINSEQILAILCDGRSASFVQIADKLDELPWDVLTVCRSLARRGILEEGTGKQRGIFSVKCRFEA